MPVRRAVRPHRMTSVTMKKGSKSCAKLHGESERHSVSVFCKRHTFILLVAMAFLVTLGLFVSIFFAVSQSEDVEPRVYDYEVVATFPHDSNAFTQGLLYNGTDTLYESTGLYDGQSSVRQVDLKSGNVRKIHRLGDQDFGEGLTIWDNRLLQVLWRTNKGFVYDKNLSQSGTFTQPMTDGWGLTSDGKEVIGSDGTSSLYFMNPTSFSANRLIVVSDKGREVINLNELEYIKDEIWANVWLTDCIVRVSPEDGRVLGWILLHGLRNSLLSAGFRNVDVLNGIAWDSKQDRVFVTGKWWPRLYQIKLRYPSNSTAEQARNLCIRPAPRVFH